MTALSATLLERMLLKEIGLYERYLKIIAIEKSFITRFNSEKLLQAVEEREGIVASLADCNNERMAILKEVTKSDRSKLTTVIATIFQGQEQKRLFALTGKLKSLVVTAQKHTREVGLITKFASNLTDGLISILWSATRHVTKSYTARGAVQENSTPSTNRQSSVLKKA